MLPAMEVNLETEEPKLGAARLGGPGVASAAGCLCVHPVQSVPGCLSGVGDGQIAEPGGAGDQ